MVATLLKLRFRVLGNQLSRSPWQLVGFIFGALYGLGVLAAALVGLVFLGLGSEDIAATVIVGVGSLATIGWVVGPMIAFGVDTTLDPERLIVFPMSLRRMMVALALAGVCGIPGIVTAVAALGTLATWVHWPAAFVAAIVTIPLGVLIAVVASRTMASLASGSGGKRRLREASGVLVFIPLILAGPIAVFLANGLRMNIDAVTAAVQILGWTPIGAAWSVPGEAAAGNGVAAVLKLAIAVATLALLWLLWGWSLRNSLAHPRQQSAARVAAGKIGWFGRVPATATGAIFARSLTYWIRDPRYVRQLITVPIVPVFLWFYARNGDVTTALSFTGPVVALFVGIILYTDLSYDGTAFGSELATGASGRADRLGRTLAAAVSGVPLVLLGSVLPFFWSQRWADFPGILGIALGILLTSYGVTAVTSAQLVIPAPGPGDNPFKRVPGASFMQSLSFFVVWLIAIGLSSPAIVIGVISFFTGNAVLGTIGLVVGVVLGAVFLVVGILVGGRMLDRTGPLLLARLQAMKNS